MVGTRRRQEVAAAAPAEQPASDSDDEAPEEVTLAVGKQSAEQRRREEAEAKAAARTAAKERRAAAAARRAAAATEQRQAADSTSEDEEGAAVEGSEGEEEEYEEEGIADEEGLDLLPDDVLAALASNKRTQPTAEQKRLISEQLRRQREPGQPLAVLGSQRQHISEVEAGPVVVRVLRPDQPRHASQSARDFLQQRLLGGVKRSADMLKPVRALQPAHIAQRQAQHLAALQAQRRQSKQAATAAAGGSGGAPQAKRRR